VVLEQVLEASRELTGARYAALGVLDETRGELARFLTLGIDEATRREIGPLPRGHGLLGELITDPVPLRLADVDCHPRSYGFPVGHPPMRSFLGVPLLVGEEPYGNLYLTDKQGAAEFTAVDEEAVVLLAEFAGVAIDHARRYTGSEQRRAELQRTVNALEATIEIARALGGQTDLKMILELVAKRGRALVSAQALVIELERGDELFVAAGAGTLPEGLVGRRLSLEDTVASAALRTGRPQRLADKLNRTRFEQHGLGRFGLQARDGLVVPLVFRNRAYGALVAIDRLDGDQFTAEHQRLLEAFAASAATAVATAQSVADERRRQALAAAEAERGRWARELHDETLQSLAALRLMLAGTRRVAGSGPFAEVIDEAVEQLDSDIDNLRGIIADLRPAEIDELGAGAAIQALAERFERNGLAVDVSVELADGRRGPGDRHLPDLETAIYRVVQEALTNASKHGLARRAVVEVVEHGETILVTVRDDGRGFDPAVRANGFGLPGMRERAELLNGTLTIDSAPGRGATVEVRFPVRGQRPDASGSSSAPLRIPAAYVRPGAPRGRNRPPAQAPRA
jgi:signal transduction histidine kinase